MPKHMVHQVIRPRLDVNQKRARTCLVKAKGMLYRRHVHLTDVTCKSVLPKKMTFKVEPFSQVAYGLAEGPHWHREQKLLYFVDIFEGLAATIDENRKERVLLKVDQPLTAILPVDGEPTKMVVSIGTELYLLDVKSGEKTLLDRLDKPGVRFNDAKCDPRERLWIGTMGLESAPAVVEPGKGLVTHTHYDVLFSVMYEVIN